MGRMQSEKIKVDHATIGTNSAARGIAKIMLEKKVKMAVSRRPPFPLPEVSSAPSWFEFSSFLLLFAAVADMFSEAGITRWSLTKKLAGFRLVSPWTGDR